MSRSETVLTVFVASPGDTSEERAILENVIRELNDTWSRKFNLLFDLVRWETATHPDFGVDAQDVINRQLGDDYDVFIGIMWGRFGTPTHRAESGTEEEFNRAYERCTANPNIPLMLYFKDAPIPPSQIDTSQLAAVQAFKKRVADLGGLYRSFQTSEEFQRYLRQHLSLITQKWSANVEASTAESQANLDQPESSGDEQMEQAIEVDEDELGYFDYVDLMDESLEKSSRVMERITQYISDLGVKTRQRTEELNKANSTPSRAKPPSQRHIIKQSANDLEEFVALTEVEIPIFAEALQNGLNAFLNATNISTSFAGDQTEQMVKLQQQTAGTRSSMAVLETVLPRFEQA